MDIGHVDAVKRGRERALIVTKITMTAIIMIVIIIVIVIVIVIVIGIGIIVIVIVMKWCTSAPDWSRQSQLRTVSEPAQRPQLQNHNSP